MVIKMKMRFLVVLLIIAIAITSIWALDIANDKLDESAHPLEYSEYVTKYSKEYGVPEHVIYAMIKVESNFDPFAVSKADARGLMQMMPDTFKWLTDSGHFNEHLPVEAMFIPEVSIKYGSYYLSYLYGKFKNWNTALAAYNAGEGNVAKWLKDAQYSDGNGTLTYIPFRETRHYVTKVETEADNYSGLYYAENTESEGKN